jgi:hypothetical protein
LIVSILLFSSISIIVNSEKIYKVKLSKQNTNLFNSTLDVLRYKKKDDNNLITTTPILFTENHGQLENDKVRFYSQDGSIWFTDDGVWFEIKDESTITSPNFFVNNLESKRKTDDWHLDTKEYQRIVLKQEFVGQNKVDPQGKKPLDYHSNFFYGNKSSKWRDHVPNYRKIHYNNLYNDIDLIYYQNKYGFKYDFIVYPGADINQIKIRYRGADGLEMDQYGNLVIKTPINYMMDCDLFIYQYYDGIRHYINGSFKLLNSCEYCFEISNDYNPLEVLIIDPTIRLKYSTFLGESSISNSIEVDNNGNVIVTGNTYSLNFPTTPGAFNRTYGGNNDIFVTKFNHNSSSLIYSTYIGGNNNDIAYDISIDKNNNIYLTGFTCSLDFPTTQGAFDTTHFWQPGYNVFVSKLNIMGTKLVYSTFIHGTTFNGEIGFGIDVDSYENAIVTGVTRSSDFPTTPSAYDSSHNGNDDIFVLKLNRTGASLDYSTYVGGSEQEEGSGIVLDNVGNAYITGYTTSSDFPTTLGVYDTSFNGKSDGFVLKLNQNGSNISHSTLIGGNEYDIGTSIELNKVGILIVTGYTSSLNFPTSLNAINRTYNGGICDILIAILNKTLSSLYYSTYLGGCEADYLVNIAINTVGEIYLIGNTSSPDFPTTDDAYDKIFNDTDVFLTKLNHNCSELLYSTYLGGNVKDYGRDICIDIEDNVYLTGYTSSPDFPTTLNAYDTSFNGVLANVFVMKWFFRPFHNISSVLLKKYNSPVSKVYSKLCTYTFNVNLVNTLSLSDNKMIHFILSPQKDNIQLQWNRSTNHFSKFNDPNNYIILEKTSKAINDSLSHWSIDFDVTFNWTYPDELLNDVQVYATSSKLSPAWLNKSEIYSVENDLIFSGNLSVKGENDRIIYENELVRGGEQFNWSGLKVVYENTTDVYPPEDEYNITLWDEIGCIGNNSPAVGKNFTIITSISSMTNTDGNTHVINISGIPPKCDKTNQKFTIRIDADNVTFSNEWPGKNAWQKSSEVYTGITITDHGGGVVDNTSIMHSISEDNGETWTDWNSTEFAGESESITVHDFITLNDGDDNFIKWRAPDNLGNGPAESESYRILVDTQPVFFSDPIPLPTQESSTGEVEVGITISDNASCVNASTIKFSTSTDAGNYWNSWKAVTGFKNGNSVYVNLNLSFPNGTGNRIRWRAYDIAGNGPTYSDEYVINVNIPKPPVIPEIKLLTPTNNSNISSTSVKLTWEVINNYHPSILFDIKLGSQNPPQDIIEQDYTGTNLIVDQLENGQTYYWTVIPRSNNINGSCLSGIWSFTIDIPLPRAILKTPENNSIITSRLPTLIWSLEYEGTETVTYDVYFGTNKDPPLKHEKSSTTYFAIDTALQDNSTYYWKIIPWVGEYEGFSSEIGSFTVKLKQDEKIPKFGIELALSPNPLEIKPGEVKFVTAIVTNLGEQNDNFIVQIGGINNTKLTAENYRQDTMEILSGMSKEFLIMISVEEDIKPGFENITIIAKSNLAEKYKMDIQDIQVLMIKILEKDNQKEKERGQLISIFYFSILLLIIILIIISIIILIIVRKKSSKKDNEEIETQDIQPKTSPGSIVTPEPGTAIEPLPVTTQQQDESMEE